MKVKMGGRTKIETVFEMAAKEAKSTEYLYSYTGFCLWGKALNIAGIEKLRLEYKKCIEDLVNVYGDDTIKGYDALSCCPGANAWDHGRKTDAEKIAVKELKRNGISTLGAFKKFLHKVLQ